MQQTPSVAATKPVARSGWRAAQAWLATPRGELALQLAMLVGLAIFYRASAQLPLTALGLALFALLALLRPDLALRFVLLTVPLYFIPKGVWDARFGIREEGVRVPLHEVVLLTVAAATALHWLLSVVRQQTADRRPQTADNGQLVQRSAPASWPLPSSRLRPGFSVWRSAFSIRGLALSYAPHAFFLLAGTLALLVGWGGDKGAALREWRWLVVEPLIFYALLRYHMQKAEYNTEKPAASESSILNSQFSILNFFLLGGALVALLGVLQFCGLNLVPLLGTKAGFSDDRLLVEGVQRVNAVYGHPNNLGLYLDRIWPLAGALALGLLATRNRSFAFYLVCAALGVAGVLVSFSKGALLGGVLALALLAWLAPVTTGLRRLLWGGLATSLVIGLVAGLALGVERLNPFGETSSIRLSTWASALRMALDQPLLGIGLDQFGRFYPQYISPALAGTNELNTAHPHNLVLDIWLRMGIPGLLAFGWLLVRLYRQLRPWLRTNALALGLAAATLAALAHGLVDSFYFWPDLAFAFWLFIALGEDVSRAQLKLSGRDESRP